MLFGPFRLDVADERLWRSDKLVPVRRKPFAILKHLAANPRRLVTYDEIVQHVWGGMVISESVLRTHVHELRQILGEALIETVIGRGYRFTVDVTAGRIPTPAAAPAIDDGRIVVGRDAELATLRTAFERANGGHRQLCFVTGEPGIGKTTLVEAFTRELEGRAEVVVARGHCVEQHGTPEAFLAVIEVLVQLRRSELGDRALAALIRHAPAFLAQIPHLVPDAQLEEVTRRARGGNEARSVRELIEAVEALATNHTIVIVLEDLQWSDVATLDLVALIGQRRERARLLVLGTSRRAESQTVTHPLNRVMRPLIARSGATAVPLDRIAVDEVRRFVDLRFPGHAFPVGLFDTIDRITAGTPLFVVSFVEDLVGRKMIDERDGRWQLTASLDDIAAHRPENVRQLIDLQLDRLEPSEQRVLEAASVLGLEFTSRLVAAALESSDETIDEVCDGLARRALFVRRTGTEESPDGMEHARYGVTHGLVQEVCLGRTPPARRQRWHRLVAEHLDAAYGARASEVAHVLAMHYDSGGVPARAVHYYAIAAARSTVRFASRDAFALFQRAHDLLQHLPPSPERDITEIGLLTGKTQSIIRNTGDPIRTPLDLFESMIVIARRLGDVPRLSAALANLELRLVTLADYDRAEAVGRELDELRRDNPVTLPPEVLAMDMMARSLIAPWRGNVAAAVEILERATRDAPTAPIMPGMIGVTDPTTIFLVTLSLVRWLAGRADLAELALQQALARAAGTGDPYMIGHVHVSIARLRFLCEDAPEAIREPCRLALENPGAEVWHPQAKTLIGAADSRERALDGPALDELTGIFRRRSSDQPLGTTYMGLVVACASLSSGDPDRARPLVDEMLAFARTRGEGVVEPELLRLRGVLLEPTDPSAAADSYLEAIALATAKQSWSFRLRAANSLAQLWQHSARRTEALAHVSLALEQLAVTSGDTAVARRLLGAS